MSGERFTLDTNILVCSIDPDAGAKHRTAIEVIDRIVELDCCLTLQAVSEFFLVATRKKLVTRQFAATLAGNWLTVFPTASASASAVHTALATAAAGRQSYWDALLIATAAEAGCNVMLTEDLADGASVHGVRIINPFGPVGLSVAAQKVLAA